MHRQNSTSVCHVLHAWLYDGLPPSLVHAITMLWLCSIHLHVLGLTCSSPMPDPIPHILFLYPPALLLPGFLHLPSSPPCRYTYLTFPSIYPSWTYCQHIFSLPCHWTGISGIGTSNCRTFSSHATFPHFSLFSLGVLLDSCVLHLPVLPAFCAACNSCSVACVAFLCLCLLCHSLLCLPVWVLLFALPSLLPSSVLSSCERLVWI